MNYVVKGLNIVGLAAAVPKREINLIDILGPDRQEFKSQLERSARLSGVHSHRLAPDDLCASDLCYESASRLIDDIGWNREEISLLVFVSQTPDYKIPSTSCILQERLGLNKNICVFDINLACSGYTHGLWVVGKLLEGCGGGKGLLLVGDTLSKLIPEDDIHNRLLFGDAGSATAIEFNATSSNAEFIMGVDGSGYTSVYMPNSSSRINQSNDKFVMKGFDVFLFATRTIPSMIDKICKISGIQFEDVGYYVLHQANKTMLETIREKVKIPKEKFIVNMEGFGNTTSASIPLAIVLSKENIFMSSQPILLVGIGAGLSWSSVILKDQHPKILPLLEI